MSKRSLASRAAWGAFDQALSSFTNFILALLVARSAGVEQFGAFAVGFATYLVALSVSRGLATEPLTIRYSAVPEAEWRRATAAATGAAVATGFVGSAVTVLAGLVLGGAMGTALLFVGLAMTPLLLQDAWRFAFFAARRGKAAFLNDLVWALALVPGVLTIHLLGAISLEAWILVWALAGSAAAMFGIMQSRVIPQPRRALAWLREHREIAPRLAIEGALVSGTGHVTLLAVAGLAGLATVGAVRAAQVLMNALHVASYGMLLFAVPEAVAIARRSRADVGRFCVLIGGGLVIVACLWGAVVLTIPDDWGTSILGAAWADARPVILPMAIVTAASGAQMGALVGLRALAMAQKSLQARIAGSSLQLIGGVGGARLGGAIGTAWGLALGAVLGALLWWYQLVQATRQLGEMGTEGTEEVSTAYSPVNRG
ncbi:hypothetical protein BH23CHL7_BH23CHL7_06430 [soil metagenome]